MCTTQKVFVLSKWGWAFCLDGFPWVAHLVWAIPTVPTKSLIPSKSYKFFTLPLSFITDIESFSIVEIPAES